jgi:hypothetical protein
VSGLRSYQRTANPRYYLAQRTTAFVRKAEAPSIADRLEVTKSKLPSFLQRFTSRGRVLQIGRGSPDPPENLERQNAVLGRDIRGAIRGNLEETKRENRDIIPGSLEEPKRDNRDTIPGSLEETARARAEPDLGPGSTARLAAEISERVREGASPKHGESQYVGEMGAQQNGDYMMYESLSAREAANLANPGVRETPLEGLRQRSGTASQPSTYTDRIRTEAEGSGSASPIDGSPSQNRPVSRFPTSSAHIGRH